MTWSASPSRGKHAEFWALLEFFFEMILHVLINRYISYTVQERSRTCFFCLWDGQLSFFLRNRRVPWLPLRLFFENLHKYKCCSSVGTSRTPGPGKPGIQLPGSWFKWEHLLPQKWRMVQSPSVLDKAHICHGLECLEVTFWFVNSPFQQVSCAEICQFANWIPQFLMANSQFVIKSKFLVNLPPLFHIFPCFHGQIVKSQGMGDFHLTQGHPGGPRLAWPCQDGSGPAEAGTDYWPPGTHHEFGGVSHH